MALSFRREALAAPPEVMVFADGFADHETLVTDLDHQFGEDQWEAVSNSDAEMRLNGATESTRYAIFAVSSDVQQSIDGTAELIRQARKAGITVMLVAGDISSRSMHKLIREGVAEFMPYPDSEGAFQEAVDRLRFARTSKASGGLGTASGAPDRQGKVVTAYGAAGGVGASTFIVNLAWEVAMAVRKEGRKVALLDFNFQYGSVATYLDVPRREAVYELVSEASSLDQTGLTQALSTYEDKLHVLTAPRDALPLDIVSPGDVSSIVNLSREAFDFVFIDMPQSLMNWSEQVYTASDEFFALMEVDMRSAQNMFRFLRTLKAEDMPLDKIKFVLNRAPGGMDLSGKARVKRVSESLGLTYSVMLPDGGKQVMNACDQGVPLSQSNKSNPLRKEIVRVAQTILDEAATAKAAAG